MKLVEARYRPVYRTLGAELAAIARGRKPISFFASDRSAIARGDLADIVRLALARGLAVHVAPRGDGVDVFVHRPGDERRIAPLRALLAETPWTFAREERLGVLLGYTAAQRAAWLAREHALRPAFGVTTVYAYVAQLATPVAGDRAFRAPGRIVPAGARLAPGEQLVRFGVAPAVAHRVLPYGVVELTRAKATQLARATATPIEQWTPRGWRPLTRRRA